MISFFPYWVLYKLHEQEDWLSLFLVLRVPCPAIFCIVAATCETHMWMAARSMTEIHIQIKPKIALKTNGYWVSLLSKENTFPLDNQRALAWNITSLCLLSCLCTLRKPFDASLNVRRWVYQFFDILKNSLQTWPLVIFLNEPLTTDAQLIMQWVET